jgi:hypothetical protein
MADKKITKIEWSDILIDFIEGSDFDDKEGAIEFLTGIKNSAINKKEAAAKKAAEKKEAGDELRAKVLTFITDELQTVEQIVAAIDDPEITKGKVVARLTQLVNANAITKETIKAEDSRKVVAYKLASNAVETE